MRPKSAWRSWLVNPSDPARGFEEHLEASVRSAGIDAQIAELLEYHFGYGRYPAARRGKRLRPQMVLRVAAHLGADISRAFDAASAIEILHNYSLVHDDIEDRDELRHGRPTLWSRFGIAQALNAGDAMCAISFLTLSRAQAHLPAASVLQMIISLHRAHRVMCDGQAADLRFEAEPLVDVAEYEGMIAAKTAALFGAACELGAYCGGAQDERAAGYRALGVAFGMAFQIQDDVSGIWASVDATGKTAANDIARRKWTFPVVWALGREPGAARSAVASAYARGGPIPEREAVRVVAALDELGAREAARRAIAEHLERIERQSTGAVGDFLLRSLAHAVT